MASSEAVLYTVDERLLLSVGRGNQREALNMLTAFGASVNGSSQQDYRPLSWAAANNHVGMIKFLVGEGADLEAKTGALPSTEVSLRAACGVDVDDTADSAANGKMEVTTTAARAGETKGMTAVHVAIRYDNVAALRTLLQGGADPNGPDTRGITPLWLACNHYYDIPGRVEMVHELLEAGADPLMSVCGDMVPLHLAAEGGDTGLIDLLVAKAPETLHVGEEGRSSPLCNAVIKGHEKAVLHLLSAGANDSRVTLANKSGGGPLACTILFKNESMMRLLLKEGLWAVGGAATAIPSALYVALSESAYYSGYMRLIHQQVLTLPLALLIRRRLQTQDLSLLWVCASSGRRAGCFTCG
eukprot:g2485.t1